MPTIPLEHLHDDPRNANVCSSETLGKIRLNIKRTGLYPHLTVRPHPDQEGHYIILDGHHRKQVLSELGYKDAECEIWKVDEKEAQVALATLNRLRGEDEPRKRAELIYSLTQVFPLPDLIQFIPENRGQVEDLLALKDLDWEEAQARIQKQIEAEEAELPVPFVCMVSKNDLPDVEKAFAQGEDRGKQLGVLCRYFLKGETNHAQPG